MSDFTDRNLNPMEFPQRKGTSSKPVLTGEPTAEENALYTHLFDQAHTRQHEVDSLEELYNT